MSLEAKKRVCYFYDANVGNYHYGPGHPMRPHRIRMCHGLVMNYGLYKKMEIYRAKPANKWEMTQFHTDDYIDFLSRVTPENMEQYQKEQAKFNVGDDSPIFEGLFEYCGLSAGGSMEGAARLNRGLCDIAINWAGGLHHAKKAEASGFCYVNDIVLGILELLRYYSRVLYIDIDVHHGDGVEEAFYTTDRVMTVSFHKYGEFFPGTGELKDVGVGKGKYYSVNFPLRDGVDDDSYQSVFEPVIEKVMEWYRPSAVVLQCGGDSLSGDKLGCFNLSMKGHANCVKFVKKFNLPTLVLGGGGYTMRNVARAWAYETGVVVGQEVGPDMPYNDYYEYFGPDYKLDIRPSNMENLNTPEYLEKTKHKVFENLARTMFAPSVQMQEVPGDRDMSEDEDEENDGDSRYIQSLWDRRVVPDNEYYDSDEGEAQGSGGNRKSRHHQSYAEEEEDSLVYDGDDSDENKPSGNERVKRLKKTRSVRVEADPKPTTTISQDEEMEIAEALEEEKVKIEENEKSPEILKESTLMETEELPQEESQQRETQDTAMEIQDTEMEIQDSEMKTQDIMMEIQDTTMETQEDISVVELSIDESAEKEPQEDTPASVQESVQEKPLENVSEESSKPDIVFAKEMSPKPVEMEAKSLDSVSSSTLPLETSLSVSAGTHGPVISPKTTPAPLTPTATPTLAPAPVPKEVVVQEEEAVPEEAPAVPEEAPAVPAVTAVPETPVSSTMNSLFENTPANSSLDAATTLNASKDVESEEEGELTSSKPLSPIGTGAPVESQASSTQLLTTGFSDTSLNPTPDTYTTTALSENRTATLAQSSGSGSISSGSENDNALEEGEIADSPSGH